MSRALADQKESMDRLVAQYESLQNQLFGRRSEKKLPSTKKVTGKKKLNREDVTKERRARAKARDESVPARTKRIAVSEDKRRCPHCACTKLRPLGPGLVHKLIEYVPARFVYEKSVLETLSCPCGEYMVTAEPPQRPFDQSPYGPKLIAHLIVTKLLDAMPHYRLEKALARQGLRMSRQTMTDLFHRAAEALEPLAAALVALVATSDIVQADETPQRRQDTKKRAYLWAFLAHLETEPVIAYRFSANRSGETPRLVLGESKGFLVVDQYSGYNVVATPRARRRAGCWAHARRKVFELVDANPVLEELMDAIHDLYRVEHRAEELGVIGTAEHLRMRRAESFPVLMRIWKWVRHHAKTYPPRSAVGAALAYIRGNFRSYMTFLRDPRVPIDNNRSENKLRGAALIRKNSLFVGHEDAGKNMATLLTLVATCVANDVNPEAYLADVLVRTRSHPASRIHELLPRNWRSLTAIEG
jgi:transposase